MYNTQTSGLAFGVRQLGVQRRLLVIRQRSKSECAALTSSFDRNYIDGNASLIRQKSPETTADLQDVNKFH